MVNEREKRGKEAHKCEKSLVQNLFSPQQTRGDFRVTYWMGMITDERFGE
jgi:hypothetical protein